MSTDQTELVTRRLTASLLLGSVFGEQRRYEAAVEQARAKYAPILAKLPKADLHGLMGALVAEVKGRDGSDGSR